MFPIKCKPSISLMAPVVRFELCVVEYLDGYNECVEPVTKAGWIPFMQIFFGFNITVTKEFSLAFDGNITCICYAIFCLSSNTVVVGG